MQKSKLFSIAQASYECGIGKEVLRKWEVRYGFPVPFRDNNGNRMYADEQLIRLKLIRKLLDDGFRPAKVVSLDEPALIALSLYKTGQKSLASQPSCCSDVLVWLKTRDPALLREKLREALADRGLAAFVHDVMPTMNVLVGEAWQAGDIAIRDEHVYSEMMQALLREALASLVKPDGAPRMLLTTLGGETHVLGLLMLEVVTSIEGAYCISLGAQSPIEEIILGAADFRADVIALSFSTSFPRKKIVSLLKDIRAQLPGEVQLWAGGCGMLNIEQVPRGVMFVHTLAEAVKLVKKHRNQEF